MRYVTPVYFQHVTAGAYNTDTGNYGEDKLREEKRYASVTDTGADTLTLVYGAIKQGSLTIRLQRPYKEPFNNIRVGEKIYRVDQERHQKAFVVSEVQ